MAFDPKSHLIQLPRRVKDPATGQWVTRLEDYLQVRDRLRWFREAYPHGTITTEAIRLEWETGLAIFKATVTDGEGGKATGYGSETRKSFEDFVEKAETRSIGRALGILGFGTQFCGEELSEGEHVADAPVASSNGHHPSPVTATDPLPTSAAAANGRPSEPVAPLPPEAGESPSQGPTEVHPTADEITKLVETAKAANVDTTSFGHDMRRLMQLPASQKVTKKFLRERMTMTQYRSADAHYREALRQIVEEDVPDHRPPVNGQTSVTAHTSQEPSPPAAVVTAGVTSVTTSTPGEDPDASATAQLKAEVAGWGLAIAPQEVEYILGHYDVTKARALLEGHRQRATKPATAA